MSYSKSARYYYVLCMRLQDPGAVNAENILLFQFAPYFWISADQSFFESGLLSTEWRQFCLR